MGVAHRYARRGERFEDTVKREVKEETGLDVRVGELLTLRSGYRLRTEIAYVAYLDGGELKIDPLEILEARWFAPNALPHGMQDFHKLLIEQALALPAAPGSGA